MKFDIVRAWKDEAYRQNLSEEQLCMLPDNPAGALELTDAQLESVYGGGGSEGGKNVESYALLACEINIATINILSDLLTILGSVNTVCIVKSH
ncbi:MAG TPA: mersacidin/lichenicidin family type 2 lantibiotic [Ktedonobacteraceae bacterium]|nr:mersacidin/lichenicidin family type 2 lantibiotic [Ktedonobacteraceae bacterium]